MNRLIMVLFIAVFPCMVSCTGTGGKPQVRHVDLFDSDDSVRVEIFKAKPLSKLAVEVETHAASVPFGVDNALRIGTCCLPDSTECSFVYVFSLRPESIDTVSATLLRYHFSLGRNGRLMLMTARHPEGIPEALERLEDRVKRGWTNVK